MTSDDYQCPHRGDTSKRSRKYIGDRQAAPETAKLLVSSILQSYKDTQQLLNLQQMLWYSLLISLEVMNLTLDFQSLWH
jgi:hypothetical protein